VNQTTVISWTVALISGLAIGLQVTLNGLSGRVIGARNTGLLVNAAGGLIALLFILVLTLTRQGIPWSQISRMTWMQVSLAGLLAIGISMGLAFAVPRVGVAAGMTSVLLGQLMFAIVVDTFGWGGGTPITLSLSRLIGLLLVLVGAWLFLPKS
jgi:bacterial/archaeal transporter family-2 protein